MIQKLKKFPDPKRAGGVVPFLWQRRFFRGDSATQAAHCGGDLFLSGSVIQMGSGLEKRTGRYMTGVKKPALGGPDFPGIVLYNHSISTLLHP
ncbi:hypothetical protein [Serratia fonticola]|uniref:hypothetical protein n=1 Tax=Serratia fonticola TaxID=47917 RepID=UPI003AAE558F